MSFCSFTLTISGAITSWFKAVGVEFIRASKTEPYGMVAAFKDLYGNPWDLLQPT